MIAARAQLVISKPYFGAALWAMTFVEVKDMNKKVGSPAGVDLDWRMYYDPEVSSKWSLDVRMGILTHELAHLLRKTGERAITYGIGHEEQLRWNVAADMPINESIDQDRYIKLPDKLPDGDEFTPIRARDFKFPQGLTTEEYYDLLKKNCKEITVYINCGSGAHGQQQDHEQKEGAGRGKVLPHEAQAIAKATAAAMREHKSRGEIPAGWQRWAESYGEAKVNWKQELASAIRRAAGDVRGLVDYSYRMPNRRQSAYGKIVMPAMVKPTPRVGIVGDASGSMDKDDLSVVRSESGGVLRALGMEAGWYCTDAEVHVAKKIRNIQQMEFKGGGGTDMGVGITRALEDKPDIIIVITDGYTPWPEKAPPCKLIACIVNEEMEGPAYAKTIKIPPTPKMAEEEEEPF